MSEIGNEGKRTRTVDFGIEAQQIPIRRELLARRHGGSQFPVRLTIQLIGPNKTRSARIRSSQQHQVGGHSLVLFKQNQVANTDGGGWDGSRVWPVVER